MRSWPSSSPSRAVSRPRSSLSTTLMLVVVSLMPAGVATAAATPSPFPSPSLTGSAPSAQTLTVASYVDRLSAAADLAESLTGSPSGEGMQRVRDELGLPLHVSNSTEVVVVGVDPFLDSLGGYRAADFDRAAEHLRAMASAASASAAATPEPMPSPSPSHSPTPEPKAESDEPSALSKALYSFTSFLGRLFSGDWGVFSILAWIITALAVAGIAWTTWRFRPSVGTSSRGSGSRSSREREPDWGTEAGSAEKDGDLGRAVHARYRMLIRTLVKRGIVPDLPGLTAGECRRAVAGSRPDLSTAVRPATTAFERVVFGRQPATQGDVDALVAAVREAAKA